MIGVRVALLEMSSDGMNINNKFLFTIFPERRKSIDDFSQFCSLFHTFSISKLFHHLLTPIFNLYFGKLYACRLMGLREVLCLKIGVRSLMFCLLGGTGCWSWYFSLEKELIIRFTFGGVLFNSDNLFNINDFISGQCYMLEGLRLGPFKIHDPQCAQ